MSNNWETAEAVRRAYPHVWEAAGEARKPLEKIRRIREKLTDISGAFAAASAVAMLALRLAWTQYPISLSTVSFEDPAFAVYTIAIGVAGAFVGFLYGWNRYRTRLRFMHYHLEHHVRDHHGNDVFMNALNVIRMIAPELFASARPGLRSEHDQWRAAHAKGAGAPTPEPVR